jgi:hypothetical protein
LWKHAAPQGTKTKLSLNYLESLGEYERWNILLEVQLGALAPEGGVGGIHLFVQALHLITIFQKTWHLTWVKYYHVPVDTEVHVQYVPFTQTSVLLEKNYKKELNKKEVKKKVNKKKLNKKELNKKEMNKKDLNKKELNKKGLYGLPLACGLASEASRH